MESDLLKFLEVFFAESEENLTELESGLLLVEREGKAEDPLLHSLFRSVHTLKGNAATFGFSGIVKLTHSMENVLDEARAHRLQLSANGCQVLLKGVDALRRLLVAARQDKPEPAGIDEIHRLLEQFPREAAPATSAVAEGQQRGPWKIRFLPHPCMLARGNDVVLMFRALAGLGSLKSQAHFDRLPEWDELDPESCYLWWDLELRGDIPRAQLMEVFEWVEDDCELHLEALQPPLPNPPAENDPEPAPERKPREGEVRFIRVDSVKIEQLINMVGELVITQSALQRCSRQVNRDELQTALERLDKTTRELRDSVLKVRMIPVASAFQRLPRLVRDLSRELDKEVELNLEGGEAELDKSLLEHLLDPLVHLVRNCLDHGLESRQARRQAGKSEAGQVSVRAYHQSGNIVIEVSDDGRGIDLDRLRQKAHELGMDATTMAERELLDLIFRPGLSTAQQVSEISGRGVGLDVARRNVLNLGGSISVTTEPGKGTKFLLRLPLTLAILDGQQIRIGDEVHIIPMFSIVECLPWKAQALCTMGGNQQLCYHRDQYIPVISLAEALGIDWVPEHNRALVMIVEWAGQRAAIVADELLEQQQVVVKSLEKNYRRVEGILGATIAGDGSVALIVDVAALIQRSGALVGA